MHGDEIERATDCCEQSRDAFSKALDAFRAGYQHGEISLPITLALKTLYEVGFTADEIRAEFERQLRDGVDPLPEID